VDASQVYAKAYQDFISNDQGGSERATNQLFEFLHSFGVCSHILFLIRDAFLSEEPLRRLTIGSSRLGVYNDFHNHLLPVN